ncbi:microfibril-associated glycoprotein 4-like [Watersipora subatra]|uniref:microfibril-associated glycoprotein 4-like n=1 Tax=Watersipora subatra TaxID=2589382 RepID=UPI00355C0626
MLKKLIAFVAVFLLLALAAADRQRPSKKTMKKLCEMEEFQQAMASDAELEPAAVVYEVMSGRLGKLETHIQQLEKKLEEAPTQADIEAVASALREELMEHIEDRLSVITAEIEQNVQKILDELIANLANLGYEQGFELAPSAPPTTTTEPPLIDCDYLADRKYESGVYSLRINDETMSGYCEIRDGQGWLVIQRRTDDLDFWKGWDDYKKGFGDLMESFYFGNDKIHNVTNSKEHVLRIEMSDYSGDTGYAEYSDFSLAGEDDGYRLDYGSYIGGPAGNSLSKSKGMQFSTNDNDRDGSQLYSCSRLHRGAFWYDRCGSANLNGVYLGDRPVATAFNWQNIFWYTWKRDLRALRSVQMMIRPSIVKAVILS